MSDRVRLDHGGIRAILRSSAMHDAVERVAEKIADEVRSLGLEVGDRNGGPDEIPLPVTVGVTTTDRAHANVVLAHPAGVAVQAKHGALTKGASAAGLTVRGG